jgi:integrase
MPKRTASETLDATLINRLKKSPPSAQTDVRDSRIAGFVLRTRPSGVHTYRVEVTRNKWHTLGTTAVVTPAQARAEATRIRAAVELGQDPFAGRVTAKPTAAEPTAPTLDQFIDQTYGDYLRVNHSDGDETIARLCSSFASFRDVPLDRVTPADVENWRTARKKDRLSPATINRDLNDLRALFNRATKKWKVVTENPLKDVEAERVDRKPKVRYLTADENDRLLGALRARDWKMRDLRATLNVKRTSRGVPPLPEYGVFTDHIEPIVLLALHTGMRRGEVFALRWEDVDLVDRRITVEGEDAKSGQTRHISLNATALRVLQGWGPRPTGLVFPGEDGQPLVDIKTAWLRLLRDAKIIGFRFHDLRHTFASRLVQAGVDLNRVRELLGHATMAMTLRYAHLAPEHGLDAVALLDKYSTSAT